MCGLNTYLYIPLSFQNRIPNGLSLQRNKQKSSKDRRIVLPGKKWHALSTLVAGYLPLRFTLSLLRYDLTFLQHSADYLVSVFWQSHILQTFKQFRLVWAFLQKESISTNITRFLKQVMNLGGPWITGMWLELHVLWEATWKNSENYSSKFLRITQFQLDQNAVGLGPSPPPPCLPSRFSWIV